MEPERQIEKTLREAARQRREQGGDNFPLHPATRRLLRGEAQRVHGHKSGEAGSRPRVEPWWQSFGWSVTAVAGIVLAAVLMWPREPGFQMAMAKKSVASDRRSEAAAVSARQPAAFPLAPPAPPASGLVADASTASNFHDDTYAFGGSAKNSSGSTTQVAAANRVLHDGLDSNQGALMTNSLTIAAADQEARGVEISKDLSGTRQITAGNLAPGAGIGGGSKTALASSDFTQVAPGSSSLAAMPAESPPQSFAAPSAPAAKEPGKLFDVAQAKAVSRDEVNNTQRFSRLQTDTAEWRDKDSLLRARKSRPQVLQTFSLQQNGSQLQVVDADGSVYNGQIQTIPIRPDDLGVDLANPPRAYRAQKAKAEPSPAIAGAAAGPAAKRWYFTVLGTNRSLQQPVVFNGRVLANAGSDRSSTNAQSFSNVFGLRAETNSISISGEAQVGGQSIKVDAVPAGR